jgi:hypothetical protein
MISVCSPFGECGAPPRWNRQFFAGKQLQQLGTVSATSPLDDATPDVLAGFEWLTTLVTSPNSYTLTLFNTGDYSIDSGGDTSRQSFVHDVYNLLLADWYGEGTVYDGNIAPQLIAGPQVFNGTIFRKGDTGTIDLQDSFQDAEGDDIVFSLEAGALPTNWSLAANGVLTLNVSAYGRYDFTLGATDDPPGDLTEVVDFIHIGDEIPDVVGETEANAITEIEAVGNFTVTQPSLTAYSSTVPEGDVISQSPEATEVVLAGTAVTLIVSLGAHGELAATLAALSLSAQGTLPINGSLTITLSSLSVASESQLARIASLAVTLGALTSSSQTELARIGQVIATLGALSLSAETELGIPVLPTRPPVTLREFLL